MWRKLIPQMQLADHNVYLVTSRGMDTPIELVQDFVAMHVPIIYCTWRAKRKVCEEQGISIDIWIDNDPFYIDTGFVEEQVQEIKLRHANDLHNL
jgi:hypothetical protein